MELFFSKVMPGGGRAEVKGATRAARHVGRLRLAPAVVVHQVESHLATASPDGNIGHLHAI